MCGIVAYIGDNEAAPIVIEGLRRLEYRGYDSAGITICSPKLKTYKKKGKVQDLVDYIGDKDILGGLAIGHTRWATHGKPNDSNAHPHNSSDGTISLVHNGIIENYVALKKALIEKGHKFQSETDTEVLTHLVEYYKNTNKTNLEESVRLALQNAEGAYAIVVIDSDEPNKMVGARKSSPLVLGIGDDGYFLASDATPIIKYTNRVVYLDDDEIITIHKDGNYEIKTIKNEVINPVVKELDMKIDEIEKGNYDHYMLKEIYQQPESIKETMKGRINADNGFVGLGGMKNFETKIDNIKRIIIVACGTSWHSALVGEYLIETLARIPVEVEYASEFRYRDPIINEDDMVIALSQSGETADTLAALELAKSKGALLYGIVNNVGSSIARLTDTGSYTHCGTEIGVASTKAFTSQLVILTLMTLKLAHQKGTITEQYYRELLVGLESIPLKVKKLLKSDTQIKYIASEIKDATNALYLGRGYNFPIALEGALKLKEISYIHAEGYPAAEMKHGPIALIDENMPVVVIATNKSSYEKVLSNIQEVKARKGIVIAIVFQGDTDIKAIADYTIEIPHTEEPLSPLLSVIPLQLLAYHIAVFRNCEIDQPRNLAKSVTVE